MTVDRESGIVNRVKVTSYKDLEVWRKGIEIVDRVYTITNGFPETERYGLVTQMQRAAVSIPSNIAEGFARQHVGEYRQFLYVSLGSCAELETQLHIAQRREYASKEDVANVEEMLDHESRMLMSLIKRLAAKQTNRGRSTNDERRS